MGAANSIAAAVLDWDAGWNDMTIERNVFGTTEPQQIASLILHFVRQYLGSAVTQCLFYETSMGCVLGLSLGDGRNVALKAQPPSLQLDRLLPAQRAQTHLADRGFPAPRPILPPTKLVGHLLCVWPFRWAKRDRHLSSLSLRILT